jgi:hypothetical protein
LTVAIIRPNAAGAENNQYHSGGGVGDPTNYGYVDEEVPDDGTTDCYGIASATYTSDLYNLENPDIDPDSTIDQVVVYMRCNQNDSGRTGRARTRIRVGSTAYEGPIVTPYSASWNYFSTVYLNNPAGGAWTVAVLNTLQAGSSLLAPNISKGECRNTQTYVEVYFTPPAANHRRTSFFPFFGG